MNKRKEWILNSLAVVFVLLFLFPVYWMVVTSLKKQAEIFQFPPTFWPEVFQFQSYASIVQTGVGQNFMNSFLISFVTMLLVVGLAVPCAYGLARYRVKGMKLFILLFLVTQMLPPTVILTPLFILFDSTHILNTYLGPILACATLGIPFSVLILRTFFLGIPKELEDAAKIDGCNRFMSFLRIVVPISMPGIVVSAAISFLFTWGDLIFSITFNRSQELWPLTAGIYNAIGRYGIEWNNLMAFASLAVFPVMVLFISLQKHLVRGLTSGAMK